MVFYFVKENKRVRLVSFEVKADADNTSRLQDIFVLKTIETLDTAGGFDVLREDGVVFRCVANNVSSEPGTIPVICLAGTCYVVEK